jgi:hypothetical protein
VELPESSASASNPRGLAVLPLVPPPLGQLTSKLRPHEPATMGEMHQAREGAKPLSEGEAPEHGEHAAAGARGKAPASDEDWTPRALPRSLLVPNRRTARSP